MNTRRLALAVGAVAVALGVAFVVAPGLAGGLGTNRAVVSVLGGVAGLLALRAVDARRRSERESATLPEVESPRTFDRPGAELTERVRVAATRRAGRDARELRTSLRTTAVRVLTTYGEYTTVEAETALRTGEWTDDPYAAAFFARTTPVRSFGRQLRDVFTGSASFDRRARHAVRELAAVVEDA